MADAQHPLAGIALKLQLAETHAASGDTDSACERLEEVRALFPSTPVLRHVANLYLGFGRARSAAEILMELTNTERSSFENHALYGQALAALDRLSEAKDHLIIADELKPNDATLLRLLGAVCERCGDKNKALQCYLKLQEQAPSIENLARILVLESDENKAAGVRTKLHIHLRASPASVEGWRALANEALIRSDYRAAVAILEEGIAKSQSAVLRLLRCMTLPKVAQNEAELTDSRAEIENHLDIIIGGSWAPVKIDRIVNRVPFPLAYQGVDVRNLQQKFATAHLKLAPDLAWHSPNTNRRGGRLRVGILSDLFLRRHTICSFFEGLVAELDRRFFEVVLLRPEGAVDEIGAAIAARADCVISYPPNLSKARLAIAEAQLDVLAYADIGMTPFSYYLALARLAPVQVVFPGHPITSGSPNIDYFISSKLMEPGDAQRHYTEHLIEMDRLPFYYYLPQKRISPDPRGKLGLPIDIPLYVCPQTYVKFHPEFDDLLGQTLRKDPKGKLVLIRENASPLIDLLYHRMESNIPRFRDRVIVLPRLGRTKFFNLVAAADVLLDTLHFGGGNTAYESSSVGTPIVTAPGKFMRGRVTLALYTQMNVAKGLVVDIGNYAETAVTIANDRGRRSEHVASIRAASHEAFEDKTALRQLESLFVSLSQAGGSRS